MLEQHQIDLLQKIAIRIKQAQAQELDYSDDGGHLADVVLLIFGLPNTASTGQEPVAALQAEVDALGKRLANNHRKLSGSCR